MLFSQCNPCLLLFLNKKAMKQMSYLIIFLSRVMDLCIFLILFVLEMAAKWFLKDRICTLQIYYHRQTIWDNSLRHSTLLYGTVTEVLFLPQQYVNSKHKAPSTNQLKGMIYFATVVHQRKIQFTTSHGQTFIMHLCIV